MSRQQSTNAPRTRSTQLNPGALAGTEAKRLDTRALLTLLRAPAEPFALVHGEPLSFTGTDQAQHREACLADPLLYGLIALAPEVPAEQQARVLFTLLREGRAVDAETRQLLDRVARALSMLIGSRQLLSLGLALRRERKNRKLASRTLVWALLAGPVATDNVLRRPRLTRAVLEHAVGRDVARACARADIDASYRQRMLLRFVEPARRERALRLLALLYGQAPASTVASLTQAVDSKDAGELSLVERLRAAADGLADVPKTVTATNRGAISATLYHVFRGGETAELAAAFEAQVSAAVAELPRFGGRLALVLDGSASMRSYGGREWALWAQALAFAAVLERSCAELTVHGASSPSAGGRIGLGLDAMALPSPTGPSDLALPLCEALRAKPDAVLVLTDGYENLAGGDLDRVLAAKQRIGDETPVLLGLCTFTSFDELAQKLPTTRVPWLRLWHQLQLPRLQLELAVQAGGEAALPSLRAMLLSQLERLEGVLAGL
jgi:hypothetical protein